MSMRRAAGRVGWGGGPGEPASLFSPRPEPQVLEERERDHGHQRVPVQTGPGAALEMVEAELLLHLLVRLLAHPARLDRICWCACSHTQRALIVAASSSSGVS